MIFFTVLTLGFVYELGKGALYFTDQRSAISQPSIQRPDSISSTPRDYNGSQYYAFGGCLTMSGGYDTLGFNLVDLISSFNDLMTTISDLVGGNLLYLITMLSYLWVAFGIRMFIYVTVITIISYFIATQRNNFTTVYTTLYKWFIMRMIFVVVWMYVVCLFYVYDVDLMSLMVNKYTTLCLGPLFADIQSLANFVWSGEVITTILSCCVRTVYCDSPIPWTVTQDMKQAQGVLVRMYDTLIESNEPQVIAFAEKHLMPLTLPVTGYSDMPGDFMSSKSIIERANTHTINNAFDCARVGSVYHEKGVIYAFTTPSMDMDTTYIGITQNVINRLTVHAYHGASPDRFYGKLYPYMYQQGGMQTMPFHVLHSMPTFQSIWLAENKSMDKGLQVILKAFTEFKLGLYEQALFDYYKPGLNTTYVTNYNYSNWSPNFVPILRSDSYFNHYSVKELMNIVPSETSQFVFPLYYDLMDNRGELGLDQHWLEWFVGFCERRAHYHSFGHTNALSFQMKELDFLVYLKESLQLGSNPFVRAKSGHQLLISGVADADVMASIFYNNIVTPEFLEDFNKFTANMASRVDLSMTPKGPSAANVDNAWLSGIIDANASFGFKERFTPIITFFFTNHPLLLSMMAAAFTPTSIKKNSLVYQGKKVNAIMEYLDRFPLKYNKAVHLWYKECLHMRSLGYQHSNKDALMDLIKSRPKSD